MPFEFDSAPVPVRPDIEAAFQRDWDRLRTPGTWWSGPERVALAGTARTSESSAEIPARANEASNTIARRPASPTRSWVEEIAGEIGDEHYVELVGIVSRLSAIDSFHRAIGVTLEPLPEPLAGEPSRKEEPGAGRNPSWVPATSGASIVYALSLVPAEMVAQEDLHGPLYLTYEGMSDLAYVGGLSRAQMELVAARTSAVNECFY